MAMATPKTFADRIVEEAQAFDGVSALEDVVYGEDVAAKAPMIHVLGPHQKWFSDIYPWTPANGDYPVDTFWHMNYADVPPLDPFFIHQREETEAAVWAIQNGMVTRFVGDPSTGKTTWAENFAGLTGRPCYRINFNLQLQLDEVLGKTDLINGQTVYTYGELPLAVQKDSVIVLDEVSRASATIMLGLLQRFLEKKEVKIQMTGEVIKPAKGLVVIACDNSVGLGEASDMFPTSNVQDVSTLNRFPITLKMKHLSKEDCASLILRHVPELAKRQATKLAEFTALCQNAYSAGNLGLPFGARQYIPIAKMLVHFKDIRKAVRYNFQNALDSKDASVVEGFINTVW